MQRKTDLLIALTTSVILAKTASAATPPTVVPGPSSGNVSGAPGTSSAINPIISQESGTTNAVDAQESGEYNPANDNPGLYHGLPLGMPEGLTQSPQSIWRRDTLLGDPWGWRSAINNQGIDFDPVYVGEVMGNVSGGIKQGAVYDSVLNLPVTVYLGQMVDGLSGSVVHANALWLAGRSLTDNCVGDISGASNIAGYDTVRLQELWFQQTFWKMRAAVKVGLIAADADYFTSDTSSLFINGTFGAFTLVGANLPDPPIYPMASPGISFLIQPIPQFYFQSGIFAGTTEDQDVNKHGTNFRINGSDGALIYSEIGWLVNQAPGDRGLVGTYKLGSFVHTADFPDNVSGAGDGANYGIYAVADQQLYNHGGRTISAFTRGGYAPADVNTIDWYFDAGFNFTGFVPGRWLDTAGIAIARSNFSHDFSTAQIAGGSAAYSQETVIEATYKIQVSPWWTLQPDFQYFFNPSGENGSQNATILGLRTSVAF